MSKRKSTKMDTAQKFHHAPARRTGRRMHIGTWAHDPNLHHSGPFLGYCPNCEYKIVMEDAEARVLIQRYCRNTKTFTMRLLKHLMAVRSI